MNDDTSDDTTLHADSLGGAAAPEAALSREIRRRREIAGLSQNQLANLIGYSRQYVSRAERPSAGLTSSDLVRAIDTALSIGGELVALRESLQQQRANRRKAVPPRNAHRSAATSSPPVTVADANTVGLSQAPAEQPPSARPFAGHRLEHEWERDDLVEQVFANEQSMGAIARQERSNRRQRSPFAGSPDHLDEILAHLRDQWHALVRTDNLLGPRFAIAGVLNQIVAIEELSSNLRGQQRLAVVRLGAQYAESAAWLYEDAGHIANARYWTGRAMELAHEGDDQRMVAWTIFRRSQQAAAVLDAPQAIGFAQAARRSEERLAMPTRAAIRVQEAYGYALDGDERAAQTLLDESHTWAASDTTGDAREGHGSYCTPSYIEIQRANCWLATSKPKKAIALYEESLRDLPSVYRRSRAAALSRLAMAYIAEGHIEQAATVALTALPVARSGGSMRIVDELKRVGRDLAPHQKIHEVAALLDDLTDREER